MDSALFMIEGGRALDMVKQHIAERITVRQSVNAMLQELGTDLASRDRFSGKLSGVVFSGGVHPDFCKPQGKERISRPKKGTEWHKRFKEQVGYRELTGWIAEEFKIPCRISYKTDNGSGITGIGNMFNECGFLFLGEDGPYAMWTPDVPAEVARVEAEGGEVEEPAKSFRLEFEGCRRILKEEWELLVAQHKLAQKQAA